MFETTPNWTGYGLTEEEMPDTIKCPRCNMFPFKSGEVQVYDDIVSVVCFKESKQQSCTVDIQIGTEVFSHQGDFGTVLPYKITRVMLKESEENGYKTTFCAECWNEQDNELLDDIEFTEDDIGKEVFFTQEEADKC